MDRFKMQAAQEVGVNLTNGYNGHPTSREAGSVGGQMFNKSLDVIKGKLPYMAIHNRYNAKLCQDIFDSLCYELECSVN